MKPFILFLFTATLCAQNVSKEKPQVAKSKIEIVKVATSKDLSSENKILAIFGAPPFLSGELQNGITERYRILWSRAFHPPIYFTISIGPLSRVQATSARMDKIPSSGPISRIDSTWVDVSVQHPEDKSYCVDFINVLRTQAASVFWTAPFLENDTSTVNLDGSNWTIEGQNGTQSHIIRRWSPDDRSELFHFLMLLINTTGLRLHYDEVY